MSSLNQTFLSRSPPVQLPDGQSLHVFVAVPFLSLLFICWQVHHSLLDPIPCNPIDYQGIAKALYLSFIITSILP